MSSASLSRTAVVQYRRALAANGTAAAYTDPVDTLTKPSGVGILDPTYGKNYSQVPNNILLKPFGLGASGNSFNIRVHGWVQTSPLLQWTAENLLEITCTLGTKTGVAAGDVDNTQNWCGTIALVFGVANIQDRILSPTGNLYATCLFDLQGCQLINFEVIKGTATSGNALWRGL